jgi:hypothetical protein
MWMAFSMHEGRGMHIGLGRKVRRKETTGKTWMCVKCNIKWVLWK